VTSFSFEAAPIRKKTGPEGKPQEFKDALIAFYMNKNSTLATAKQFGMSYGGARKILFRAGVLRSLKYGQPEKEILEEMLQRWRDGESQSVIGKAVGFSQTKVGRILREHGHTPEDRRSGANSAMWKGGRWEVNGYVRIFLERTDPLICMADSAGYVLEHRLVVARWLGRPLHKFETVHHIDGNGMNNDLQNLQLRQGKHGRGAIMCCLECGSKRVGFAPLED
jgi:hypothetical protein